MVVSAQAGPLPPAGWRSAAPESESFGAAAVARVAVGAILTPMPLTERTSTMNACVQVMSVARCVVAVVAERLDESAD